jgi:hypothetical protein
MGRSQLNVASLLAEQNEIWCGGLLDYDAGSVNSYLVLGRNHQLYWFVDCQCGKRVETFYDSVNGLVNTNE